MSEIEHNIFQFDHKAVIALLLSDQRPHSLTVRTVKVSDWISFHDNVNIIPDIILSIPDPGVIMQIRLPAFAHHSLRQGVENIIGCLSLDHTTL
jgi:hypothetical protein